MGALVPFIIAALAAGAILLIFVGLAGNPSVDPVQARLTQLGTMQAKNLEELELQQPLFERTIRPLMARLSGSVARVTSQSFSVTTEKLAGDEFATALLRLRKYSLTVDAVSPYEVDLDARPQM